MDREAIARLFVDLVDKWTRWKITDDQAADAILALRDEQINTLQARIDQLEALPPHRYDYEKVKRDLEYHQWLVAGLKEEIENLKYQLKEPCEHERD